MNPLKLPRPVPNKFRVSSPFGNRILEGKISHHNGVDFACPVGTPVQAVADGRVYRAGWENDKDPKKGFGLRVMQAAKIDGEDYWIFYGHLNAVKVDVDQVLEVGQVVGLSGHTGHSTGPHLHVGVRKSNTSEWVEVKFSDGKGTV